MSGVGGNSELSGGSDGSRVIFSSPVIAKCFMTERGMSFRGEKVSLSEEASAMPSAGHTTLPNSLEVKDSGI